MAILSSSSMLLFINTSLHHIQILGQKMDLKASTHRGKFICLLNFNHMPYGLFVQLFSQCSSHEQKEGLMFRYSGDLCPIDVDSIDDAEDLGTCLTLKVFSLSFYEGIFIIWKSWCLKMQHFPQDGGMAKLFVKNVTTGENEFSVSVNIFRNWGIVFLNSQER